MTISYRVRKQIVDYFAQRKSSQEIASMLNVSLDQIQDWRRRYKHGHEDWVFSDHQKFSIQERKEILVDFFSQQKYGIKAYAARHNLSYNTFKGWVKKVRNMAVPSISPSYRIVQKLKTFVWNTLLLLY